MQGPPPQSPLSPYVLFQGYAPGCAEDCCFTACLILPRRSPVDVAQFPLLAAADSQHPPSLSSSTAEVLRLPWQKFSSSSPRRPATSHKNLLSHWTPLSSALVTSPRLCLTDATRPRAPPRLVRLLKNNRCSRVCAVCWELSPSWLQTVIGAPGLTPTDPSPHRRTTAPLCLPPGSRSTCVICGTGSLLQFETSLERPSRCLVHFSLIQQTVPVLILVGALFDVMTLGPHIRVCSRCDCGSEFDTYCQSGVVWFKSDLQIFPVCAPETLHD